MSRSTIDPRDHRGILTSRRNGANIDDIAEAFDYPPAVVAAFLRTNTRPTTATTPPPPATMPKGPAGTSTGQRPTAARVITEPAPTPMTPAPAAPAPVDVLEQLLNAATTPKAKRLAAKAREAVDALQAQVDADTAAAAAKAQAERAAAQAAAQAAQERAAAKAEVERLAAALADARKRAGLTRSTRTGTGTGPAASDAGTNARTIRTWATTNGIPCPIKGRLPQTVITAYTQATTEAGAA